MLEGDPVTFIVTPPEENGKLPEVVASPAVVSPAVAVKENATGEVMLMAEEENREQENPAETVETAQEESVTEEVVTEESTEQIAEEKTEVESNPPSTEQVRTKRPIMYIVQPPLSEIAGTRKNIPVIKFLINICNSMV